MKYYAFIEENKINGVGQCQCLNEDIVNYEISEEVYNAIIEDSDHYIWNGTEIVPNPNYEEVKRQKEEERINNLTMTALDFINTVKSLGLSDIEIDEYLQQNIPLKNQLTYCQNVYCGVVRNLLPLEVKGIIITDEMVVRAFKLKNGETPDVVQNL